MADVLKIDEEVLISDDIIKLLKLSGRFDSLLEDIIKEKLTVYAAKKQGITVSPEEIQERADQLRRVRGLHRASDVLKFFDAMGITIDEFEDFIVETLYQEKMLETVGDENAVKEFFALHSPRFDSIEVSHILVDSEGKARELMSLLEEEPEMFEAMVAEHSLADTKKDGGRIGKVIRGAMAPEVEGRVFNASEGDLLGPFAGAGKSFFEIFRIDQKRTAELDDETREEVRRMLRDEWLAARAREHQVEVL